MAGARRQPQTAAAIAIRRSEFAYGRGRPDRRDLLDRCNDWYTDDPPLRGRGVAKDDEKLAPGARPSLGERRDASRRECDDVIYRAVMRTGGEPFGAPFEVGLSSLTQRLVHALRQIGFFRFETLERLRPRHRRNKFTRHGAAPFVGDHPPRRGGR
jgi:hypothetical protein